MPAAPQKVVTRAAAPVVTRPAKSASAAQAVRANPSPSRSQPAGERKVSSPRVDRMAGSIIQGKAAQGKSDGAAGGLLKAPSSSKVAQYLAAQGAPALRRGMVNLQRQKRNEQTHDNAGEKLKQSEMAVELPLAERQSTSNSGRVESVSTKPAPTPDENKAKSQLTQSIEANIPKTLGDVDDFKGDKKAQVMSTDVLRMVQADKDAVASTYKDMEQTPTPAPKNKPDDFPPEELAPPTPNMNLGTGAVAQLQKEHTDVSAYTKEADSKLKEEGITQEQLDMVDSGDLAQANKEKKGLEKAAQTEPAAIQKFAQQEGEKVDKELKQEEQRERADLKGKRKSGLGTTAEKQKGTKSALERKREEVHEKINGIFKAAQDKVKKKLADLETQSMKRFDDGNAKASKEFEDNVDRELEAYKDDRYSGVTGKLKKAKDWLLGMDDLPEVKAIFERNRSKFVAAINKLVDEITADNKRVIKECKDELDNAKKDIKDFVSKLGPGLTGIGKKAAAEMDAKLDELDQFVNRKAEELQTKLKDKQQASIKAIDDKIEKMKEAMSGALAKLGKLLLWAAKKFFTWALEKFGYSLAEIEAIINKGVAVLKAIFTQPIQFVKNLMNAAITGFKNFGKNFLVHLKNALFEWLTGSLEGLVLPKTWDFQGIISVALQMIGISYQNIRKHMVTVMGEPVVAGLEKTFTLVKTLITEGPMAAWEQLKEMAGEMRTAFEDAVKDFIKTKIIEQAIQWLISIFIPGAGIIKAIIGIYDTIVFFIQKAKQIMQMIANFLGSIAEIAAGNIGAAADAMEKGLARGLSLVISFLASLLRLSGITGKIRDAIQKIRGKVDAVLLKVAKWIAEKAKTIWGKVKETGKQTVDAIKNWWGAKKLFKSKDSKTHTIYFSGSGKDAKLMVASDPLGLEDMIDLRETKPLTKEQAEALTNARKQKRSLDEYIASNTKSDAMASTASFQAEIDKRLETIRTFAIGGDLIPVEDQNLPLSNLTFSTEGKKAKTVKIEPLTKLPGNTKGENAEGAGVSPPGWTLASELNSTSFIINPETKLPETTSTGRLRLSKPWKRVHLASHRFHGPFKEWNVTPAEQAVNTGMLTRLEDPVDIRLQAGEILSVEVSVDYHSGSGKIEVFNVKGDVVASALESDYPKNIHVKIGSRTSQETSFSAFKEFDVPGTPLPKSEGQSVEFTILRYKIAITEFLEEAKANNKSVTTWGYYYDKLIRGPIRERLGDKMKTLKAFYDAEVVRLGLTIQNPKRE